MAIYPFLGHKLGNGIKFLEFCLWFFRYFLFLLGKLWAELKDRYNLLSILVNSKLLQGNLDLGNKIKQSTKQLYSIKIK